MKSSIEKWNRFLKSESKKWLPSTIGGRDEVADEGPSEEGQKIYSRVETRRKENGRVAEAKVSAETRKN